jgi:hypothetical protein
MQALACSVLAAGLALAWSASRAESGPKPPVEIRDSTDPWVLDVDLDRARYLRLYVTQADRGSSDESGGEIRELAPERAVPHDEGRATLELAIERRTLAPAADGVYAQRISIDAVPISAGDSVYHTARTLYFRVTGGTIERIGMREYSAVVDPVHVGHDAAGREIVVHAGGALLDGPGRTPGSVHEAVRLDEKSHVDGLASPVASGGMRP